MKPILISDFTLEDSIAGGSEFVNDTVAKLLDIKIIKSNLYTPKKEDFLIISNISTMKQGNIDFIKDNCNYVILEHDYKIHWTRHPWRFKDCIIPKSERINYDLYKNAKAVFTQTDDHTQVFKQNEVTANFVSLKCSIWSDSELNLFSTLKKPFVKSTYAIIDSDNYIKNTNFAVEICKANKWEYELIPKMKYDKFLEKLSGYSTLVFFPMARETCCRLLVEAKCLGLNVITSDNSGAFRSEWFNLKGIELIKFLKDQSLKNIKLIGNLCTQ